MVLCLTLLLPKAVLAGNLDGLEKFIRVIAMIMGLALMCWVIALVNAIRLFLQKPYKKAALIVTLSILMVKTIVYIYINYLSLDWVHFLTKDPVLFTLF